MLKKIPDTFHIGAISALVLSVLAWLLISRTESFIVASALKDYLAFPRLYFIVFALQLVFLRIMMVNLQKQHFARGWMFSVFIFALFVFYLIKKS
ncbi:MAG: hypothetical protein JST71_00955 [Bacteroidetes bacterium]|nr:hypothetical protein [Bacteroidota bacterium]MBX7238953.1 hypothetical protein [Bacteroidia bacterium]MCC7514983.1 hypothetical protein [Bacteroidia bacterium]MCW5918317.1 hypothetical protein [Bacteroidota bacterium]HCI57464.1 hypothetical protein [Bacteroidota bacterium]